jgi:hypothetical protein
MGLFSPSPNLVNLFPSKTWDDFAQLSARCLLDLRHGPSARLQGVAIVAGYEPPVQRSACGRRDPRFDFGRRDPRFCWTPPRVSLELFSLAHPTVSGLRPAMLSILPHPHAFRCRRSEQASAYLASLATVSGTVNTAHISYLGCALRTVRLSGFRRTRSHPCVVATHHILHTRPPDTLGCTSASS